jgi:hypothetical protein
MKTKRKNTFVNPISSDTVSADFSTVLAELEAIDYLLENLESKVIERRNDFALFEMRFRRNERVYAAYSVRFTAMPYQQTKVDIFPYVKTRSNSSFVMPIMLVLVMFTFTFGSLIFRTMTQLSAWISFIAVTGALAYLAIRYGERQRNKPAGYVEEEARLLLRSIRLALVQAEDAAMDSEGLKQEETNKKWESLH